jgi:hypothetical protein
MFGFKATKQGNNYCFLLQKSDPNSVTNEIVSVTLVTILAYIGKDPTVTNILPFKSKHVTNLALCV